MSFSIRPITEAEWEAYCEIRSQAYHLPFQELIGLRQLVDLSATRCLFVDGHMKATGRLFSFEQYLHGQVVPMGGIASLAVRLEERGKGYIRDIVRHMLHEMHQRQIPVSCLYPSVYALYRRFGFELVSELRSITVTNQRDSPFIRETSPMSGTIRRGGRPDLAIVQALYERAGLRQNGYLRRNEEHWHSRVLHDGFLNTPRSLYLWYDSDHQPQGYMLLNQPQDNKLLVKELIAHTSEALLGLLSLLQQDNVLKEWTWDTTLDSVMPTLLYNPRSVETRILPSFMARIVDVATAWQIVSPSAAAGRAFLGVHDATCPWNEGTWELEVAGGRAQVHSADQPAQAVADIGTWSQLLYGYLSFDQALFAGKCQLADPAVLPFLRALWPAAGKPLMVDSF